jgi:redox-sensitive bicupin YhaK (pirin superfamily)
MSPTDLGQLLKPFVFLDLAKMPPGPEGMMRWHPHSGIATVTVILEGEVTYQETTGASGRLGAGGVEWMASGGGVWHTGASSGTIPILGYQLWIALPPEHENAPPRSSYLNAGDVPSEGPARVILGRYGSAVSSIDSPPNITYVDVRLAPGETWTYETPPSHDVAWLAVYSGSLGCSEPASAGDMLVFNDGKDPIMIDTVDGVGFVLGSAKRHRHDLHLGNYSVHTSASALRAGEGEIMRLGNELKRSGIIG